MQDGSFSYPPDGSDFKYLLELRAEAEYYGLTGLLEHIDRYPVSHKQATHAYSRLCMLHNLFLHAADAS